MHRRYHEPRGRCTLRPMSEVPLQSEPRLEFWNPFNPSGARIVVTTEVFRTAAARQQGLRGRTSWPRASALFVFPRPTFMTFEMVGTPMDLDLIFVRQTTLFDGVVEHVERMPANSTKTFQYGPVTWAIEMPAGLAAQFGVGRGTAVSVFDVCPATE